MAIEDMAQNTGNNSEQSCPRSYKPWVWTLIIMALLTLVWAFYEGYQEGGVYSLMEGDRSNAMQQGKQYSGMFQKSGGIAAPMPVENLQNSYHEIIEITRPAVISIDAVISRVPMNNAGAPEINFQRIGSGVIISPRGYALSSYHVIEKASSLRAFVYGKGGSREYPLKVVNAFKNSDLVLLRIQGSGPFAYAVLGDSKGIRTGDVVLAMGSPFGFEQTITAGIISSRHRTITISGTVYEDILQTDTPINRGNSGGPLVNIRGEVIGINTAIYSSTGTYSGIGFAIPINKAETLVAGVLDFRDVPVNVAQGQIVAWANNGSQMGNTFKLPDSRIITPPHKYRGKCLECHPQLLAQAAGGNWLGPWQKMDRFYEVAAAGGGADVQSSIGVSLIEVDSVIARQFGLIYAEGLLVDRVYAGSPAEKAALLRGDIIRRLDGRKIRKLDDFTQRIASARVGSSFNLSLIRDGRRDSVTLTTAAASSFMPSQLKKAKTGQPKEFDWLGAEILPLNRTLRPYVDNGVYVADVEGILAAAGVKKGDIIKGINRDKITDISSFMKTALKVDIQDGFLLDIIRSGRPMYIKVQG